MKGRPPDVSNLVSAIRHPFVGRVDELAHFASALACNPLPFQVLLLFGPGGIGKTTLLGEFARLCKLANVVYRADFGVAGTCVEDCIRRLACSGEKPS